MWTVLKSEMLLKYYMQKIFDLTIGIKVYAVSQL